MIFFFFQAEDGIRDVAVTGVQTCALPISRYSNALEATGNRFEDAIKGAPTPLRSSEWRRAKGAENHVLAFPPQELAASPAPRARPRRRAALAHRDAHRGQPRRGNVARGSPLRRATPLWQFDAAERGDARRGHCWLDGSDGPESSLCRADAQAQPWIHTSGYSHARSRHRRKCCHLHTRRSRASAAAALSPSRPTRARDRKSVV